MASAVKAAGVYGIHRTAKALRVDYYGLKKRVQEESARSRLLQERSVPTFVELARPAEASSGECILELEEVGGAKSVLSAAALTYVASALASVLTLLRLILLSRRS